MSVSGSKLFGSSRIRITLDGRYIAGSVTKSKRSLPGCAATVIGHEMRAAGKTRWTVYGRGTSGEPTTFDVVTGTYCGIP